MKLVFILSLAILSSCEYSPSQNVQKIEGGSLHSFEDVKRGVVCYRFYGREGISCLQLEKPVTQ